MGRLCDDGELQNCRELRWVLDSRFTGISPRHSGFGGGGLSYTPVITLRVQYGRQMQYNTIVLRTCLRKGTGLCLQQLGSSAST